MQNSRDQSAEKKIGPIEAATLQPVWSFSASEGKGEGDFTGTPVIAGGCLYVASNGGFVFAANADNGQPVWTTKLKSGGSINSSVTVADGKVFASVSRVGRPYNIALDQKTGKILWEQQLDSQGGADTYATPRYYKDMIFQGVSGGSAELSGDEAERYRFQGSYSILDADTGRAPQEDLGDPAAGQERQQAQKRLRRRQPSGRRPPSIRRRASPTSGRATPSGRRPNTSTPTPF